DSLLIHDGEPLVGVVPLGMFRRRHVERGCEVGGGELPGEVLHERPGDGPRMGVAGPWKSLEHLAVDDVPEDAVDLLHLEPALGERRVPVPGEGVARLPVVVVGVEDPRDLISGCHRSPTSCAYSKLSTGATGCTSFDGSVTARPGS